MNPIEEAEREISILEKRRTRLLKQRPRDTQAIEAVDQMLKVQYGLREEFELLNAEIMSEFDLNDY